MRHLREKILHMVAKTGEGHIPSAFSVLDIIWILYDKILNVTPDNINDPDRDRFILSKGHSSLGLYMVLLEKGFISQEHIESYAQYNGILGGHPDKTKVPGIEASTGSLGHGLPIAVGLALSMKIKNKKSKIYTIVGDGECNEGSIWEAALLASHHKLNNLCCIVDYNHSGDRALGLGDMEKKFDSFGWEVTTVNGHNHKELEESLTKKSTNKPIAVIAKTIKGYGSKTMQDNMHEWHHKCPTKEELEILLKELQ